jgi:GT2 family glycosyltransferase
VLLDPDWLAAVTEALDRDSKLGAVQTRIRRDSRVLDGAGIEVDSGTFVQAGHRALIDSYAPVRPAWGVSATAALYRVTALRQAAIGADVLHPDFFAWYEDVELCARLHEKGWRTAVLPALLATHAGSRSAVVIGARAAFLRARNRYWTARLHPGVGRIRSLLIEDVRHSVRAILHARFAQALYIVRGAWVGMTAKVPPPSSPRR